MKTTTTEAIKLISKTVTVDTDIMDVSIRMVFRTATGDHAAVAVSRNGRGWDVEPTQGWGGALRTATKHLDEIRPLALRAIRGQHDRAIRILEKSRCAAPRL